jgi:hypothetical protein
MGGYSGGGDYTSRPNLACCGHKACDHKEPSNYVTKHFKAKGEPVPEHFCRICGCTRDPATAENETARVGLLSWLGWTLDELVLGACSGVGQMLAGADSRLVLCRGYVIRGQTFMEHWWTRSASGYLVDPLMPFALPRVEIDAGPRASYEGVGSFDCLAMTGRCQRAGAPCEWCETRYRLDSAGLRPFELEPLVPAVRFHDWTAERM